MIKLKLFTIYILGYLVSYMLTKNWIIDWKTEAKFTVTWSTEDRNFALAIGSTSWFSVVAILLIEAVDSISSDQDEPAAW